MLLYCMATVHWTVYWRNMDVISLSVCHFHAENINGPKAGEHGLPRHHQPLAQI